VAELDALRGIAAFIVLLHHALGMSGLLDLRSDASTTERVLHTLLHFSPLQALRSGRAPVLFFFVLSGFVLTAALVRRGSPGLLAFGAQRTVRLCLPVAASVMLSLAVYLAVAGLPSFAPHLAGEEGLRQLRAWRLWLPEPGIGDALRAAALLRTEREDMPDLNPVLWSLTHEWRLTVLMPLVLLFVGRAWLLPALALLAMALGVLGGAAQDTVHLGPRLHSSIAATLYFAPGIAAGAALALLGPLPRLDRRQRLAAGLSALALSGLRSDLACYAASVLLIVLAVQPGGLREVLGMRPLVWLGRVSFSLYLVHVPLLAGLALLLHGLVPLGAAAALGVLASLPAAGLMHRWVERPSRDLAVRLEFRLRRPRPVDRVPAGTPAEPLAGRRPAAEG
jgi:peptidoglycan/LPS O-acetylase OafA/YrhL